jgi:hypothetical protein
MLLIRMVQYLIDLLFALLPSLAVPQAFPKYVSGGMPLPIALRV